MKITNSEFKITSYENIAANSDRACMICLCDFKENDKIVSHAQTAQHVFHIYCLTEWATKNSSCPLCRQQITKIGSEIIPQTVKNEEFALFEEDEEGREGFRLPPQALAMQAIANINPADQNQ